MKKEEGREEKEKGKMKNEKCGKDDGTRRLHFCLFHF